MAAVGRSCPAPMRPPTILSRVSPLSHQAIESWRNWLVGQSKGKNAILNSSIHEFFNKPRPFLGHYSPIGMKRTRLAAGVRWRLALPCAMHGWPCYHLRLWLSGGIAAVGYLDCGASSTVANTLARVV